jgi:hypothetical protein
MMPIMAAFYRTRGGICGERRVRNQPCADGVPADGSFHIDQIPEGDRAPVTAGDVLARWHDPG